MDNRKIIGIGELLWDCVGESRRPAGALANVAYHATQWGLPSCLFSRVGNDPLGKELTDYLASRGVDASCIQVDDSLPTSTVDVDVSQPDKPTYIIHENVAWDNMQYTPQWEKLAYEAQAICFGTLAQRCDASRDTLDCVLTAIPEDCLTLFDLNLRPPFFYRKWIERSLFSAWIVKISADETEIFANEMGFGVSAPGKELARAIRENFSVPVVCFTFGKDGCSLYTEDDAVVLPGIPIQPLPGADAVGAGDAFDAALIYGFLNEFPPEKTLNLANRAAAYVAAQIGSMPDVKEFYQTLLNE